jgi:5-methylcytosine-specific restriction endonuclease McrA
MSTAYGLAFWALVIWLYLWRRKHGWLRPRRPRLDRVRFASRQQRSALYRRQRGLCARCGLSLRGQAAEAHHIEPWSRGGRTVLSNLVLLHVWCHDEVTRQQASVYGWRRAA